MFFEDLFYVVFVVFEVFSSGLVVLYTVFMFFPLPETLVKTLAKNLLKNMGKTLVKNLSLT